MKTPLKTLPIIDQFFNRRGVEITAYDAGVLELGQHPRFGVVEANLHVYTNPGIFMIRVITRDEAVDMTTFLKPETLESVRVYLTERLDIEPAELADLGWAATGEQEETVLVIEGPTDVY